MKTTLVCPACGAKSVINPATGKRFDRCRGCGSKRIPQMKTESALRIQDDVIAPVAPKKLSDVANLILASDGPLTTPVALSASTKINDTTAGARPISDVKVDDTISNHKVVSIIEPVKVAEAKRDIKQSLEIFVKFADSSSETISTAEFLDRGLSDTYRDSVTQVDINMDNNDVNFTRTSDNGEALITRTKRNYKVVSVCSLADPVARIREVLKSGVKSFKLKNNIFQYVREIHNSIN